MLSLTCSRSTRSTNSRSSRRSAKHAGTGAARRFATGTRFSAGFLLILRSRYGQIVHARDYADVLSVSRGLGGLPELLNSLREETPAYALSEVSPRDPEALEQYRDRAASSIAAHGGRYLVRGAPVEAVEGNWPDQQAVVLVEFPSREGLQHWYESTEYAQALAVRDRALDRRLLFLERCEPRGPMTIREQGERLYAALDAQDWDLLQKLIAPEVTIQVGSEPPLELEQWKARQAMFYLAFPDGHHVIDASYVDGSHS